MCKFCVCVQVERGNVRRRRRFPQELRSQPRLPAGIAAAQAAAQKGKRPAILPDHGPYGARADGRRAQRARSKFAVTSPAVTDTVWVTGFIRGAHAVTLYVPGGTFFSE